MNTIVKTKVMEEVTHPTVPTRICQTCGVSKSLDHFVSMYTEASTSNCDECRKHQREVYRCKMFFILLIYIVKQLKKRKMSMNRLRTMTLRSSVNQNHNAEINQIPPSYPPLHLSSPIHSISGNSSPDPDINYHTEIPSFSCCVPSQRWISCWVNAPASSIPVARPVVNVHEQHHYSYLYHI